MIGVEVPDEVIPVVIVGAGPTGVSAATALAQYGVRCLVLDRWSEVYPQPRAVHLDDEIHRLLARLGVAGEFAAISRPADGLRLLDRDHRVLAEFGRDQAGGVHGFPKANMFDQPVLEALLRANLAGRPTARLRGDVEVTGIDQDGPGPVRVSFTDRATGATESVLADYVLGCDGANSVVRTAIGATMRGFDFEQRWLVIDVETDAHLDAWEGVHQVCDPARAATYMRIDDTRYRWEFQLRAGETAADYADIAAVHPLLAPWTGDLPAERLRLIRAAEYTFRAQVADRWRDRRVFLLGDAAHLTPPFIGQGMGAGLRDAANLAWKLAGVLDGTLQEDVLDSYQTERQPHVTTMIRLAILMGRAMTSGGRIGDRARRMIAPRLHLVPGLRRMLTEGRTPPLHDSALVHRRRRRSELAGTLCPNPLIDGSRRLDDLTGGAFVLITGTTLTDHQRRALEQRRVSVITAAPGERLHRWLGRDRAALVRPDKTVMWAGRDLEHVCRIAPPSPCAHDSEATRPVRIIRS